MINIKLFINNFNNEIKLNLIRGMEIFFLFFLNNHISFYSLKSMSKEGMFSKISDHRVLDIHLTPLLGHKAMKQIYNIKIVNYYKHEENLTLYCMDSIETVISKTLQLF